MKRIFGIRVRGIRIRIRRGNKVWFVLFFVSGLDLCLAENADLFCFSRCSELVRWGMVRSCWCQFTWVSLQCGAPFACVRSCLDKLRNKNV